MTNKLKKRISKINQKYEPKIQKEKSEYYEKYKNVKGFKSRFFRSDKYKKIVSAKEREIKKILDDNEEEYTISKEEVFNGPLVDLIRGAGKSIYSKIIKRITKNKPFYFQKTEYDENGNVLSVERKRTVLGVIESLTDLVNDITKTGSDDLLTTWAVSNHEETSKRNLVTLDIYLNR